MGDMGNVVAGMPRIKQGGELYGLRSALRMDEGAAPLFGLKGLKKQNPSRMECFDEFKRPLNRSDRVVKPCPGRFVIGGDRRTVFGKRKAHAEERVHVAVGGVVNHLTKRPAAFAVGGVELALVQLGAGVPEVFRQLGERPDSALEQTLRQRLVRRRRGKAANRIARVRLSSPGLHFSSHGLKRSTLILAEVCILRATMFRMRVRRTLVITGTVAVLLGLLLAWRREARATPKSEALPGLAAEAGANESVGFDRNEYPGDKRLAELHRHFAFAGYWLNNPPGTTANTWSGKRQMLRDIGFGFLVLWNGRLDAEILHAKKAGSSPTKLGQRDAAAAVAAAQQEGFPAGTVLFLDQEEGGRLLPEQAEYFFSWTEQVAALLYLPGAYLSGQPSPDGMGANGARLTITTAQDVREQIATRHLHRVVLWVAQDACPPAPGCVATAPRLKDSGTPDALVWQYAQSPRRPELTQSCAATYAVDGSCYGGASKDLFLDLDVARSADPSHGR